MKWNYGSKKINEMEKYYIDVISDLKNKIETLE